MKKRIVVNALCSWAEAVSLSAGEQLGSCRDDIKEATVEVFQEIRQVSNHVLGCLRHSAALLQLCAHDICLNSLTKLTVQQNCLLLMASRVHVG